MALETPGNLAQRTPRCPIPQESGKDEAEKATKVLFSAPLSEGFLLLGFFLAGSKDIERNLYSGEGGKTLALTT